MLTDTMHEQLSVTSRREAALVSAEWNTDPERWKVSPTSYPDLLEVGPDSEQFVAHPLQHPGDLIGWDLIRSQELLSPEFLDLLGRRHRVLIRDLDPRALRVDLLDQIDPQDPGAQVLAHTEEAGRPVATSTVSELAPLREQLTLADWRQLTAVWDKVAAMVEDVATFLASTRPLTPSEELGEKRVYGHAQLMSRQVARLVHDGVDTLAQRPR